MSEPRHMGAGGVGTRFGGVLGRALAVAALCAPARADGVQAVLAGSHVTRVISGGSSWQADQLVTGQSSGQVSALQAPDFPVQAADDLNLQSYFARNSVSDPSWTVELGSWWDQNGPAVDFFLFEVGGNDAVSVAPMLPDGGVGQFVAIDGWTPTGYSAITGPNVGQAVHGLSFRAGDLRKADGAPLAPGEKIRGLRFESSTIDGASFAAVATGSAPQFQMRLPKGVDIPVDPRLWSPMEVLLQGPAHSQLDDQPNPFLDYRLQVMFTAPSGARFDVPGFFDGNGSGLGTGDIWKVRFTPSEVGDWEFSVSFRTGSEVAVSLEDLAGAPADFDGLSGSFVVGDVSPSAEGFQRLGMLQDVGQHYLRFQDGTWFLKGGTNSPENLLAYFGFDDVADSGNLGLLHRYIPHRVDWQPGDPDWTSATTGYDGRGLIGALDYLSSEGVNSVYLLPMNLGGDGQDVSPFVGQAPTSFDKLHYDVSRLQQWNLAFEHAQAKGILLHLVLAETEPANETWLDGGALGTERKLFYREMCARFGHHNALQWNLSEENDYSLAHLVAFADWIRKTDPYDHPITVHNHPNLLSQFTQLAGNPLFAVTSNQYSPDQAGSQVEFLRTVSQQAGRPWAVCLDENLPADTGLQPGNADDLRKRVLWDAYLSGAAGVEWYFGYQPLPIGGDVDVEDFRTRAPMWRCMRFAREFVTENLPFPLMLPADALLAGESAAYGGGEVFCLPGVVYAVYLPSANPAGTLDLTQAPGSFLQRWFNPRTGAFEGTPQTIAGGSPHALGPPPSAPAEDWVVLLEKL